MLQDVTETGEAVEVAPATIKRQPALPRDSLTGEHFNGLPALVTHDLETDDLETEEHVLASELSPEVLECQRRKRKELTRQVEQMTRDSSCDSKRSPYSLAGNPDL